MNINSRSADGGFELDERLYIMLLNSCNDVRDEIVEIFIRSLLSSEKVLKLESAANCDCL